MIARFFKDSAIYSLAQIAAKGISILMLPFYTRMLSKSEVGWLDILMGFYMVTGIVVGFELTNAQARFVGEAQDDHTRRTTASTALIFTLFAFAVFMVPSLVWRDALADLLFGQSGQTKLMCWALVATTILALSNLITNQLRWAMRSLAYGVAGLLNTFVSGLTTVILVWQFGHGVEAVPMGMIFGGVVGIGYTLHLVWRDFVAGFNAQLCRDMLVFSLPLIPGSLGAVVMLYVNRVAVQQLMSAEDLGVFSVATRISMLGTFVMLGFNNALTPLIYSNFHKPETPQRLADIFRYFVALTLLGLGCVWLFSRELVLLFSQPAYLDAAGPLCVLAFAIVMQQSYVFAPGAWIRKRTGLVVIINLFGGVLNACLSWWFISRFGLMGAAWANLITAVVVFVLNFLLSQHFYPIPFAWRRIVRSAALVICIALVCSYFQRAVGWSDLLWKTPWLLAILASVILGGVLTRAEWSLVAMRLRMRRGASLEVK